MSKRDYPRTKRTNIYNYSISIWQKNTIDICHYFRKSIYEPLSAQSYEAHYKEQQIKYLTKKAAKFGFQLAPVIAVS